MINEKEKLMVLIDHLDSVYSKMLSSSGNEEKRKEHWKKYNQLVGDNVESWYDYIFWLTVQIGE